MKRIVVLVAVGFLALLAWPGGAGAAYLHLKQARQATMLYVQENAPQAQSVIGPCERESPRRATCWASITYANGDIDGLDVTARRREFNTCARATLFQEPFLCWRLKS